MALSLRHIGLGLTGVLIVGALGATLGALTFAPPVPSSLSTPPSITSAAVSSRSFVDERTVTITLKIKEADAAVTPRAGRVTALNVTPGSELTSGSPMLSLDGHRIIALHTATPLYREINDEAVGTDIEALQNELVNLGYDIAVTGRGSWGTRYALADLLDIDDGNGGVPASIPHDLIFWLPAQKVNVKAVNAHLGDVLEPNAELVTLTGGASSGFITLPPGAVDGSRVLKVSGKDYPVPDTGIIEDQALLQAIVASEAYTFGQMQQQGKEDAVLSLPWKLAEPIDVQAVPAAALFDVTPETACVSSGGKILPVTIIASELGQSFITTAEPLTEVDLQVEGLKCP
ncbi:hypothetical protein [Schaalia sp. Marseille-Q2122]|uniref:hypothetical protein n=1 Tax=Schaalia sp. Marseille-Q2122 TaxID=2736604 RepID=UPI00158F22D1|nr:hypothetical protein [Schaalia sp. Marseille-Q2122]